MKHPKIKLATALFGLSLFAGAASAKCGSVTITEMNWASGGVVTAVSKFLMTQGYGCNVTVVPSATVPAVTSVAETGKPDVITELWLNSAPAYAPLEAAGKVKTLTNVLSDGGVDAWWIPKYLADAHPELTKLEGILANPKLVGGLFNNAPNGWGVRAVNDNLSKVWNLEGKGVKVFNHGSGETLAASLASAYQEKAPWFGYYWAPTSVLGKYPMVQVDMGSYQKDVHACNLKADCAKPGKSGFPRAGVVTAVTTSFAKREPEIEKLMSKVSFTNDQMSSVLAWQEGKKASNEEAAVYFLTTYKSVWGGWLNDDARKNLANLLK